MEEHAIDFGLEGMVSEPETAYAVNKELNRAWQIVEETGANLFLTGRAGTGKTTFLRKLRERTAKRMMVLAPTGVAAINAQGATIHSFFQFPFSPYLPGQGFVSGRKRYVAFSKQKKRIIASLSLLVIDEVSMVRPDILDAIDSTLRRHRNRRLPFGGVQLLLIGDLRQLPPVVNNEEWELLSQHYRTPYFFESLALRNAGFQSVELTTIYRQRDTEFISILNKVRDGKADQSTLARLNSRYIPDFRPADSEGYIRLTTHNHMADSYNNRKLSSLPGRPFSYSAEIKGDFPESMYPAAGTLSLKEGAQVMFIKNDTSGERRYYNGMLGIVTGLSENKIRVKPLNGAPAIDVEPAEWENTRYIINEETKAIDTEVAGLFRQFPLRLAWAITIHKSQGLTFEKAIIDAHASFAPGQAYVALSRCTSLEGMVLSAPVPSSAVIIDDNVSTFSAYCDANVADDKAIAVMKGDYLRSQLADLFDFSFLETALNDFYRAAEEYIVPYHPEVSREIKETRELMKEEIESIADRFVSSGINPAADPRALIADRAFLERVKKGCAYFLDRLEGIGRQITGMPKDTASDLHARRLNTTYDTLADQLELKTALMQEMKVIDFSIASYLAAKGAAATGMQKERHAVTKRKRRKKSGTGVSGGE